MALGAVEVSPLEMAQAYVPFSNGGLFANPYGIERIRSRSGQVLYEHRAETVEQRALVVNNPALSNMNRMMRAVVRSGTGTRAGVPGYDIAGKTGTTSDYKDAWFVGFTGGFTTAVWVGKDNNKPMKKVTGGGAPAEIWRSFMTSALPRLQVRPIPEGPMALPSPMQDAIGDLLQASNEFFEDPSLVEEAPLGEPMPAPVQPQPYQPQPQPYQPRTVPAEVPPYRQEPDSRPAETPSLEDYVAARPG